MNHKFLFMFPHIQETKLAEQKQKLAELAASQASQKETESEVIISILQAFQFYF